MGNSPIYIIPTHTPVRLVRTLVGIVPDDHVID